MRLRFIEDGKIQLIIQKQPFLDRIGFFPQIHPDSGILFVEDLHDLRHHAGTSHQGEGNVQFAFVVGSQIL